MWRQLAKYIPCVACAGGGMYPDGVDWLKVGYGGALKFSETIITIY